MNCIRMASVVTQDFRRKSNFDKHHEVDLFTSLAHSIETNSKSVFTQVTHGPVKNNVRFKYWRGRQERCEIADLLIISRSVKDGSLRATFWQAKKEQQLKPEIGKFTFHGQENQWELLSRRPYIQGVKPFTPPPGLLRDFRSPAIGSYGVFYLRGSKIEVAYAVANCISCGSSRTARKPLIIYSRILHHKDLNPDELVALKLKDFLCLLFANRVGARLDPNRKIDNWIISYAKRTLQVSGRAVAPDYFPAPISSSDVDTSVDYSSGPAVLLIDPRLE